MNITMSFDSDARLDIYKKSFSGRPTSILNPKFTLKNPQSKYHLFIFVFSQRNQNHVERIPHSLDNIAIETDLSMTLKIHRV